MALTIGTDSYITVDEANALIAEYYTALDPLRSLWDALTPADREVYVRRACMQLERLPFRGRKYVSTQTLAFPRDDNSLTEIKKAQALQAMSLSDTVEQGEIAARRALRAVGVKSYSMGNMSENLGNISDAKSCITPIALGLLDKYLNGGYRICILTNRRS